jgi:hypothetical protein
VTPDRILNGNGALTCGEFDERTPRQQGLSPSVGHLTSRRSALRDFRSDDVGAIPNRDLDIVTFRAQHALHLLTRFATKTPAYVWGRDF